MKIYINGQLLPKEEARISVLDRGYLFGEGLFETFRSYDGQIPFLDKHINRMEWSATFIGIPFPHPNDIRHAVNETLKANGLANARVKMVLSASDGSMVATSASESMEIHFVVMAEEFKPLPDDYYKKGVSLVVVKSVRNDPPPLSSIKSLSWLSKLLAKRECEEKGAYDGILLNEQGYVTETGSGNLFWVEKDCVYSSPASMGLLGGITRAILLEILKEQGIPFQEKIMSPEGLGKASEVLITNSLHEVIPVTHIDLNRVGKGTPGELTQKILKFYKEKIKSHKS